VVEPIGDARARLTRPGAHTVRLRFHPTAAGAARLHVTQFLRSRDLPTGVIDDARLVVSELVANAVQHGRPSPDGFLNLGWELNPRRFVLSVEDGGDQPIRPREAEPDAVDGRGLHIVESLSDSWTVDREAGTTMVCASISIEDGENPPR
jgi:serine/threonine-protein kinase RsbW